MTRLGFARLAGTVLVVGHVSLFFYGFVVAIFGNYFVSDVAQMVLMGSPVLALTAVAGFRYMFGVLDEIDVPGNPIHRGTVILGVGVIFIFLASLFVAYTAALFEITGLNADAVKLAIGIIETALGGYLGVIRETLFPEIKRLP